MRGISRIPREIQQLWEGSLQLTEVTSLTTLLSALVTSETTPVGFSAMLVTSDTTLLTIPVGLAMTLVRVDTTPMASADKKCEQIRHGR